MLLKLNSLEMRARDGMDGGGQHPFLFLSWQTCLHHFLAALPASDKRLLREREKGKERKREKVHVRPPSSLLSLSLSSPKEPRD